LTVADEILEIYSRRGPWPISAMSVSMAEHALQAAHFARIAAAPPR